jgi:glutaminyl-peptide cyclotransferase
MRLALALAIFCVLSCKHTPPPVPHRTLKVNATLSHSRAAFTQGLAFAHGRLFEGTGLYGSSSIRELDPITGDELRRAEVDDKYFGEGITVFDGRIYELTWREHRCLVYDVDTFKQLDELSYEGEGWGLTNDGTHLITSDGSSELRFRDPKTMAVVRSISVLYEGKPVTDLNELEYVNGTIWANVWRSDAILRVQATDGRVLEVIDTASGLPPETRSADPDDVLNGIAFDDKSGRLIITGKRWPLMFDVRLQ